MKIATFIIATFIIAMVLSTTALAFENEPEGFRGIKWGSNFSVNAKELVLQDKTNTQKFYTRKGEKLTIGGAKLKNLLYVYEKGKFTSIAIITAGVENKSAIIDGFKAQFGEPDQPNEFMERFLWFGDVAKIMLDCNPIIDECHALIVSTEYMLRRNEYAEKAAAGAAKDF